MYNKFSFSGIGYGLLGAVIGSIVLSPLLIAIAMHFSDEITAFLILLAGVPLAAILGACASISLNADLQRSREAGQNLNLKAPLMGLFVLAVVTSLTYETVPDRLHGPSDRQMITAFHTQKSIFESLVPMVAQDKGLTAIYGAMTWPKNPNSINISNERIKEYRTRLSQIGASNEQSGLRIEPDSQSFLLTLWSYGQANMFSPMVHKGYAYLAQPPTHQERSLDHANTQKNDVTYYRHIEGNWYLFYEFVSE